jgi:hypothetical protein
MLNNRIMILLRAVVLVGVFAASVMAQSKLLTIADTTARRGDTLLIPIKVGTLTTVDSVYSGQMTFSYNSSVVSVFGVQTVSTLLNGVTTAFNATSGSFSFAGSSILTGSGVLLYLKAVVIGTPGTQTTVSFVSASLNEGKPSVTLVNGKVRVLAIQILPKNPSSLVVGDSLQFSYTGDFTLPITWSTPDAAIGKVDGSGKFKALAPGQSKVVIKDSHDLQDSSALFAIYPALAKSLTVSVHDTSYTQTLTFSLPIYLSDVTGLKIISSQLTLTFNANVLQAVDVLKANSKTASWALPTFNITSGRIDIALAGSDTLSGSGVLAFVKFKVKAGASGSTQIALSSVLFNENLNANTVNGTFNPLTAPVVVIAPSTATRTVGDTLRFSVTSGGKPPYQWSTSDPTIASINSTGLLTALKRGTITVSVVDSLGFSGSSGSIVINDFNVSIPDTSMRAVDTIDVPIVVGNVTGLGVLSFEGRIVYDSTVIRVLSMPTTGTLSSGFSVTYKDTLDTLRIAAAGSTQLVGSGALLKMRLRCVASSGGASSPLKFVTFKFNEGIPTATTKNGSVTIVTIVASPPIPLLKAPSDGATGLATALSLSWNISIGATSYRLQVSKTNNFATLVLDSVNITGTSVAVSGLQKSTTYFWRVNASNSAGTSAYSVIRSFTTATPTEVWTNSSGIPHESRLEQNYPNPFNPSTIIRYGLPSPSALRIVITNTLGQEVAVLKDGEEEAGYHEVEWRATVASGIYFYRIDAVSMNDPNNRFVQVKKMLMLK